MEIPGQISAEIDSAALYGEELLDDEAERGIATWTSPTDIARLLLMRRIPMPIPREHDLGRFRVLGAIIPDLDRVVATEQENLPTPAKPILPVHMRPALLAGVAIVERTGPEMLRMLRGHMIGRACKVVGSRGGELGEVVILHLKGRVSPLERPSQRVVENRDTHVEKRLYRPSVPAHLLLLDHAL